MPAQGDEDASLFSQLQGEQCMTTTMTLSDIPHCTVSNKLAERVRQHMLYDRDDSLGRNHSMAQTADGGSDWTRQLQLDSVGHVAE